MFDGLRESWEELPPRRGWPSILVGVVLFWLVVFCVFGARAQQQPQGQPVINQITQIRQITVGATKFLASKGIMLTDATACQITVLGSADSASVVLSNVQTGIWLPMSLVQISATTCVSAIFAGY